MMTRQYSCLSCKSKTGINSVSFWHILFDFKSCFLLELTKITRRLTGIRMLNFFVAAVKNILGT